MGLGITAVALLMAAAALFGPRHDRPLGRHGNLPPVETAVIDSRTTSPANDAADTDALAAPIPSLVIERYETERGPVEQRTERWWVRKMVVEPETGTEIEMMFPELRIEIFEIDEDPPATKKKP